MINRILSRILLTVAVFSFALGAAAQSACDKLMASGVRAQQTLTVASQRKAISYFEKAKACYDSEAKKALCDEQITACRNIIAQLSRNQAEAHPAAAADSVVPEPQKPEAPVVEQPAARDVTLSLDCTYLKFKGKGGEFKKARVICNYPDWTVTQKPEWVNCSKNDDGEIVVEADKNPTKEERSGVVIIECGDKSVSLTIIQEKYKKFGVL